MAKVNDQRLQKEENQQDELEQFSIETEINTECNQHYKWKDPNSESICWSPNGQKIIIKDKQKLASQVLPIYFKSSKIHSFLRQLNIYSFRNTKDEYNQSVYFHPNFTQQTDQIFINKELNEENTLIMEHFELQYKLQNMMEQQRQLENQLRFLMKIQTSIQKFYVSTLSIILRESVVNCSRCSQNIDILCGLRRGLSSDSNYFGIPLFELANQIISSFNILDIRIPEDITTPLTEESVSVNYFYRHKQFKNNIPSI